MKFTHNFQAMNVHPPKVGELRHPHLLFDDNDIRPVLPPIKDIVDNITFVRIKFWDEFESE